MTQANTTALRAFQTFGEPAADSAATVNGVAPVVKPAKASRAAPVSDKRKPVRLSVTEQRLGRHLVIALGAVVAIMLGVSLEHLATGIRDITHAAPWSAWALAIAIDVGMVASEVALIVLATFPNIQVAGYAHRYVIATIAISIALNVWAFWPPGGGSLIAMALALILGGGIPLGVYHLTRVAGRIWLAASNRIAPT